MQNKPAPTKWKQAAKSRRRYVGFLQVIRQEEYVSAFWKSQYLAPPVLIESNKPRLSLYQRRFVCASFFVVPRKWLSHGSPSFVIENPPYSSPLQTGPMTSVLFTSHLRPFHHRFFRLGLGSFISSKRCKASDH